MSTHSFGVANCPDTDTAMKNVVAISVQDAKKIGATPLYLEIKNAVYIAQPHPQMEQGKLGFSKIQRGYLQLSIGESLTCKQHTVEPQKAIATLTLDVDFLVKTKSRAPEEFDGKKIMELTLELFIPQIWSKGQPVLLEFQGNNLMLTVSDITLVDFDGSDPATLKANAGILNKQTTIQLQVPSGSNIKLINIPKAPSSLIGPSFNFESMGIGGLDKEFAQIFRRAFASRIYPADFVKKVGINHVRGMLLYGPPGTGKTLIARQIGKMLNCRPPKIVMGPEVLNKFVGQSEENIRNLFADAEAEQAQRGDDSELHIIIMDELDAICKQRGSSRDGTGVHDTVVNQLLSKIDGVNSLNNILLIGMTNRKDMIDEALLRPGRLEVHVEVGLPDKAGRLQILKIHTAKARNNGVLNEDVDLEELSAETKNFSGAEIEGLVKSAVAFAFNRHIDANKLGESIDVDKVKIVMDDFKNALTEVRPAFGAVLENFEQSLTGGFINYGPAIDHLLNSAHLFVRQLTNSSRSNLMTVLLHGSNKSGKSAVAVKMAINSGFPFVKMVSPEKYVGFSEQSKVQAIQKVFDDAYKSSLSIIVIDDLELLLEYVPIGPRFSNSVLQCLKVLLKTPPPKGRKLMVIGTSTREEVLESLELKESFISVLPVPLLHDSESIKKVMIETGLFTNETADECSKMVSTENGIGIKRLLMVCEMARTDDKVSPQAFEECLLLV